MEEAKPCPPGAHSPRGGDVSKTGCKGAVGCEEKEAGTKRVSVADCGRAGACPLTSEGGRAHLFPTCGPAVGSQEPRGRYGSARDPSTAVASPFSPIAGPGRHGSHLT